MADFKREIMGLVYHHLLKEGYKESAKALKRECPQLKEFEPPHKLPSPLEPSLAEILENFFKTKSYIIDELNLLKSVLTEQESLVILTKRLVENFKYLTQAILLTSEAETESVPNQPLVSLEENNDSPNKKLRHTTEEKNDKFVPVCYNLLEEQELMVDEDIESSQSENSPVQSHITEEVLKPFMIKIPHEALRALLDPQQLPAECFRTTQETLNNAQELASQETNIQTEAASIVTVATPKFTEKFKTIDLLPDNRQHVEKSTISLSKPNLSCKPRKIGETNNQIIQFQPPNQSPSFPASLPKEKNPPTILAQRSLPQAFHHLRETLKLPNIPQQQQQIIQVLRSNPQLMDAYTKQRFVLKQQMQKNQNQQAMPGQQGPSQQVQQGVTNKIQQQVMAHTRGQQQNQPTMTKLKRIAPKTGSSPNVPPKDVLQQAMVQANIQGASIETIQQQQNQPPKLNRIAPTAYSTSSNIPYSHPGVVSSQLAKVCFSHRPTPESQGKRPRITDADDAGARNEITSQLKRCRQ